MKSKGVWGRTVILALVLGVLAFVLPSAAQPATVKLWNWNIHDKKYQQKMYKQFTQQHPDIKIEYSSISNTVYGTTLEAAFVANEPPDLFLPVGKFSFGNLRDKGLIMSLNEAAGSDAEVKEWMARFPTALRRFVEGVSVFNGKAYIVDTSGVMLSGCFPLFYNKTLFKAAGVEKPPATYSQLRQTAAKIAQAGQGKYFGISHGLRYSGAWSQDVEGSLAWASGIWEYDNIIIELRADARYHAGTPEFYRAMQVWIGMREDGSVYPGDMNMEDEAAKMAFATNKAAFFFGGWWVPGNVLAYNTEADFDLVLPPTPDDGINRGYLYASNVAQVPGGYVVSAAAKNPRAVWEVIKFICSAEYQEGYVRGGYGISYLPETNKRENYTVPQMYKFATWGMDPALVRIRPTLPENALKVANYLTGIYPRYEEVLDNVYLGKAGFEALVDVDNRRMTALEDAIRKAQEAGIKVTKDDFIFADWDMTKDYVRKPR